MATDRNLPVCITYEVDGHVHTARFALLVVACDPRFVQIDDCSDLEERVKSDLKSYTFHTSLVRADRRKGSLFSGKFHPKNLDAEQGELYALRDEVRAHVDLQQRDSIVKDGGETLVTVYQLHTQPMPKEETEAQKLKKQLEKKRDAALASEVWLGFEARQEPALETLYEDYFAHFEGDSLKEGLPWKVLDAQGENHTIYVASFTAFESALQCYEYGELLLELDHVKNALPKDKDAPIAVVGAGVSGIMFAALRLMRDLNYTNVTLLEKTHRIGGKTRTVTKPSPLNGEDVPCELGTCYLSPAYDKMILPLLAEYDAGEKIPLDSSKENPFRSVIDPRQAVNEDETKYGVEFEEWVVRENGGTSFLKELVSKGAVVVAMKKYKRLHKKIMGTDRPLPRKMPSVSSDDPMKETIEDMFSLSFEAFLNKQGLQDLKPLFTYIYEVQGYGLLRAIPAYYGMVWITAEVIRGILKSQTVGPFIGEPDAIFALSKGWLTLWENMVKKEKLKVLNNVTVKSITRS